MEYIYVDSCVFISYLTNEMNSFNKFKGERYVSLFDSFYNKTFRLVISTWVINEVKKYFRNNSQDFLDGMFENMLQEFKEINNIVILKFNEEDKRKARELDSKNYPDALHVILAHKYSCTFLTTENIVDFIKYKHLVSVIHPLELI